MAAFVLETREIVKDFGGTRALDHVSLAVRPGEVHAVVGENGAGKSTLMKIICGALKPDSGTIHLESHRVQVDNPHHAMQLGIAIVHQQFTLVPALAVAENIFLGRMPVTRLGLVDWPRLFREAKELLGRLDFDLDGHRTVQSLGAAGRQITEIARALSLDAKVLIMDEPSAVLGPNELERLFRIIRKLRAQGKTVLYISHRLAEIFDIADRVTVLKDGRLVGTYAVDGEISRTFLISRMVGREWSDQFPARAVSRGRELLRVENLARRGAFEDVNLTLHAGEIVGLAGLVGSGRTEVCKAIVGAHRYDHGQISVEGRPVRIRTPRDALAHGIVYLSEDRHREGVVMCLSVGQNITLPILRRFASGGLLNLRAEGRFADEMIRKVGVRARRGRTQIVASLSGGNQQKVALAKWLSTRAKVYLLDEPTAGIDVGAKSEIYQLVTALAASGAAVLLVSSEIPEVLSLSSRVLVMRKGRISAELSPEGAKEEDVLHCAT
jgi:ABC-type sugar transport system ATPase subunit